LFLFTQGYILSAQLSRNVPEFVKKLRLNSWLMLVWFSTEKKAWYFDVDFSRKPTGQREEEKDLGSPAQDILLAILHK